MQLVLAPLMGITGPEFRRIYHRHFPWFDRALAPFVSAINGCARSTQHFREVQPEENRNSIPLEPQILGKDGALFREMSHKLRDNYGYAQVNWNIGCPSATVTARQRGSGILPHPHMIEAFLQEAFDHSPVRISIKTRLGFADQAEWERVAPILKAFPLAELTIHPRTGKQQYEGLADREAFARAAAEFTCPLLYNGDICSPADVQFMHKAVPGLGGIMIGRGALADPFLPGRIKGQHHPLPGSPDFLQALWSFHDDLAQEYLTSRCKKSGPGNPGLMMSRMKELWQYWVPHFGELGVKTILKSRNHPEYEAAVARLKA